MSFLCILFQLEWFGHNFVVKYQGLFYLLWWKQFHQMYSSINKNPPEISFMAVQFKLIMAGYWQCQTNPGFNPYLPPVTWLTRLTICVKTSNIEIVKIYNSVFSSRLINLGEVLCQIVNKSLFQLPPFHFLDRYMYCPYLDYHLNMLYSQRWNLVPVPDFFPCCVIFQDTICKTIFLQISCLRIVI